MFFPNTYTGMYTINKCTNHKYIYSGSQVTEVCHLDLIWEKFPFPPAQQR